MLTFFGGNYPRWELFWGAIDQGVIAWATNIQRGIVLSLHKFSDFKHEKQQSISIKLSILMTLNRNHSKMSNAFSLKFNKNKTWTTSIIHSHFSSIFTAPVSRTEYVLLNKFSEKFLATHRKTPVMESFLSKVPGLRYTSLIWRLFELFYRRPPNNRFYIAAFAN